MTTERKAAESTDEELEERREHERIERGQPPRRVEPEPVPVIATPSPEERELHRRVNAASSALVVLAILAVLTVCYFAKLPIIVVLISILLSFILAPLADLLQRLRLPRSVASALAVLFFLAVLYGIGIVSYNRAVAFTNDLPKYSGKIRGVIGKMRQKAQSIERTTSSVLPQEQQGKKPPTTVTVQQEKGWTDWLGGLGPAAEVVFIASFIPFLAYFMLSWQDHVRSATVMLFRMKNRNTAYVTLGLISSMIRSFIVGNVLVGLFIGAASTIMFGILHLQYFYFIGFISGFLSLVPYLGVLLALVPPVILGLGQIHGGGAVTIVVTVLGLHLFALNVLYPKFLGSRLQLNPMAVTLSLLFWGWLWGAMGLVLAIPVTAAVKIVFDHVEPLRGYGAWLGE